MSEPEQPTAEIVYVTPEIAEQWLGKNGKNRNLKIGKIEQYARDMAGGRWQLTGEAVKFDSAKNMLDGQNRCQAVLLSGATVPMFVIRGLSPESQEVMDSGAPRSRADALKLRDYTNSHDIAAAVTAYQGWVSGYYKSAMHQSTPSLTNSEALAVAGEHPGLVEAARQASGVYRSLRLPRGAISVALYVLPDIDADAAADFFDRICDMRTSGKGDPVQTLLKRVAESRDGRTRIWVSTGLFYLFRAWNAYRTGEKLTKFQLGSNDRGWTSIPEPK